MGVHTGDSIVVAPSQTLSDAEYQLLRTAVLARIAALTRARVSYLSNARRRHRRCCYCWFSDDTSVRQASTARSLMVNQDTSVLQASITLSGSEHLSRAEHLSRT